MGRMYTAAWTPTAFGTAAGDLVRIVAGATEAVVLHSVTITATTETDDSNVVHMGWVSTDGTGGTTTAANPTSTKTNADSATIAFADTTDATGWTDHSFDGMSVLAGFQKIWTPECRPVIEPTETFCISFEQAFTADPTLCVTIEFEEIG